MESKTYGYFQLLSFAIVGLLGSLLAALFVHLLEITMKLNPRGAFDSRLGRVGKAVAVGIFLAALSYPYPELRNNDNAFMYLFQDASLNASGLAPLAMLFTIKFVITIFSVALTGVPCGVFTPLFVMGLILGRFCGEIIKIWFPYFDMHPSLVAVGALRYNYISTNIYIYIYKYIYKCIFCFSWLAELAEQVEKLFDMKIDFHSSNL